jgi:DNA-binding transcriptional regulator YiaG
MTGAELCDEILMAEAYREALKLSEEKFAPLIVGVGQKTYNQWVRGDRHPGKATRMWLRTVVREPEAAERMIQEMERETGRR